METPGGDSAAPSLCSSGCGFFSNYGSGGMCSKCFRQHQASAENLATAAAAAAAPPAPQQELEMAQDAAAATPVAAASPPATTTQQQQQAEASVTPALAPAPAPAAAVAERAAAAASSGAAAAAATPEATAAAAAASSGGAPAKTPTRCQQCRKKVGLTGFTCKCGLLFCGQHRYAEAHECSFDYKTSQRAKLAAANPLVQAAKVERI